MSKFEDFVDAEGMDPAERARLRSTIAFRATAYSHGATGPRSGR